MVQHLARVLGACDVDPEPNLFKVASAPMHKLGIQSGNVLDAADGCPVDSPFLIGCKQESLQRKADNPLGMGMGSTKALPGRAQRLPAVARM